MKRHDDSMSRRPSGGGARPHVIRVRSGIALGSLVISALCLTLAATADETAEALAASAVMPTARPFDGMRAVGALFREVSGKLPHFCTAAVVRSRHGDLLITAAHCLDGKVGPTGVVANVRFAPGYRDSTFPYGSWPVKFEYADSSWRRDHDPDDDVAFLVVGRDIEKSTGAETVATARKMPQPVQVIGYPDATSRPVTCTAPARYFYVRPYVQLIFRFSLTSAPGPGRAMSSGSSAATRRAVTTPTSPTRRGSSPMWPRCTRSPTSLNPAVSYSPRPAGTTLSISASSSGVGIQLAAAALALTCSADIAPAMTDEQPGSPARPPIATSSREQS